MSERAADLETFVAKAGWGDAEREPIPGDASTRRYLRLTRGQTNAILMDAPRGVEAPAEPIGATVEARQGLGYNALARLAGPEMDAFVCLAKELTQRGYSAPRILAAEAEEGFAILEDLGSDDYASVLATELSKEPELYEAAVDTLAAIYRSTFPEFSSHGTHEWRIRDYDEAALLTEVQLLLDWYAPDVGVEIDAAARVEHNHLWQAAFATLQAHPKGLALRDFHAQNLFWLPERDGQARVGLIDFQDALFAHPAYDLASLLEDARRDVDPDLHEPFRKRFCDKAGLRHGPEFEAAYAVTAAQRNAKILGIFVRLAVRDGKGEYRLKMPRVADHFRRDLSHPACEALRDWYAARFPELFA